MSDNSFSNIPPGLRNITDTGTSRSESSVAKGVLTAAPRDLQQETFFAPEPVRLRGDVVRTRQERGDSRTVKVRTERGDIDVRIPESSSPSRDPLNLIAREGQRVQVEIQAGRNGEQVVVIRPAPQAPAINASSAPDTRPAQPGGTSQQQPDITISKSLATKIRLREIERQAPEPLSTTGTVSKILPPGSTVSIKPLSPSQISAITLPPPILISTDITADIVQNPALQNSLIRLDALPAQTQILQPLVNLEIPPLATTPLLNVPLEAITQNITGTEKVELPPLKTALLSAEKLQTPVTAPQIAPPFNVPSAEELLKSPLPGDKAGPPAVQSLNVLVEDILPPAPDIVSHSTIPALEKHLPQAPEQVHENIPAGSLLAVVEGLTPNGLPALNINLPLSDLPESFALQTTSGESIPVGTRILLTPQTQSSIGIQNTAAMSAALPETLLTPGPWPVMQEIAQALAQSSPAAAQVFNNVVANAANPTQITPAAMFFIAAVRAGDMGNWLGEKVLETLRSQGRSNLLSRLGGETSGLSRLDGGTVSQDWRGMSFPLIWQNEMQKVALYYKHDGSSGGDEERSGGKQTRFIFDLNLSRMGKVQLDGLLRNTGPKDTKLDLIVRTREPFTGSMQQEMRRTYVSALEQAGFSGELSFTAKPENWVTINPDKKRPGVSV